MLFTVFDRLLRLFEMLLTFASSDISWLTFTASVAVRPAATFVMRRSAPAAPTDTSPAAVAAEIAVPPTGWTPPKNSVPEFATEFAPSATEFAVAALAAPPIATESVPAATESASIEFAWKYLMPPPVPVLMLFTVFDRLLRLIEMLLTFASSDISWLTFTASVAVRPAATFVMRRSAPAAPTDTSPAAVAAEIAVPPTGWTPPKNSVPEFATEFAPSATEFAVAALAAPPIATESVPAATESASIEFAWKYLMPPPVPVLMLFTVFDRLLRLIEMLLTFASSDMSW